MASTDAVVFRGQSSTAIFRWASIVLGIALLMTGATATFTAPQSNGTSLLIASGTIMVALALVVDRVRSIEGAGVKLQLDAAVRLEEARVAEAAGDSESAERLRGEARLLFAAAHPLANRYEQVRNTEPSGWGRTRHLESIFREAKAIGRTGGIELASMEKVFESGTEGNRIFALGVLAGSEPLRFSNFVVDAISRPRSAFEQYQALLIAADAFDEDLPKAAAQKLAEAAEQQLSTGRVDANSDRGRLALKILESSTRIQSAR